jgi:cytochrome c biogenesis protein CcdA
MNQQRMMDQFTAVFGVFMTFFYIGIGFYLMLSQNLYYVDKYLRNIVGFTFVLYGLYRGFRTYQKLRDAFFSRDGDKKYDDEE